MCMYVFRVCMKNIDYYILYLRWDAYCNITM